jgi:hypothetical protein
MGARKKKGGRTPPPKSTAGGHFVGRDSSPVLDKYPAKDPALAPRGPPKGVVSPPPPAAPAPPPPGTTPGLSTAPASTPPATAPTGLISLERPFDVDEFSSMLGETSLRVTVPREDLPEVLRRVVEFMGFGIYVYSVAIRPAPSDLLKSFVVELHRVDYSATQSDWIPFVEKGASDSPFGPSGTRTSG